ncbi:MAG: GYF domain-containing protein [Planctomycetota bacterium]
MSVSLEQNRWSVKGWDFAARVIVPDLPGFFAKLPSLPKGRTLIVEPGTRALVIDSGLVLGEAGPGEYTLETFLERLQFWRNKQATVILTRCEDVPIQAEAKGVPCLEAVSFDVSYRWTVQVVDVLPFLDNLFGARDVMTLSDLAGLISPIVDQAVRDAIGQHAYDIVAGPDFASQLRTAVLARVAPKLQRYGLSLNDIQHAQLVGNDGGLAARRGELWLTAREQQLRQAAMTLENTELAAKADDMGRKVELRKVLRDTVAQDELNKIGTKEDFERRILTIDRDRLLRNEERESLVAAYEERKADREGLRGHLLATIDLQRERELDELRIEIEFASRMITLNKELELNRLNRTVEAEQWRDELEREKAEAVHRREQKHEGVRARWARIREARQQRRDDSWETLLHEQRTDGVQGELDAARAERQRLLALRQAELEGRLAAERLEVQKRQEQWELEHKNQRSSSQLERLQRVQEMNAQFAERQQRLQLEIENAKSDSASKRDLERIQAMSSLSTEAMIATSGAANASLLADLKKHEATQDAVKTQAAIQPATQLNEERLRLYEKLNETERAKADAIAEAYKMAMQAQQGSVQQMIGGLAQAARPLAPYPVVSGPFLSAVPPAPPYVAASPTPPPLPTAEPWHVSFHGQQSPPMPFAQVHHYIQAGQVTRDTLVWRAGMATWLPAGQTPELSHIFSAGGPPPLPGAPAAPSGPPPLPR